ncbi:sulfurtransferase TusA family protein [Candidatus Falkowbacteria bacterium]|jgi:tRNA 2-thiouridine synthesizing protein A|nr:sulfurtransferase TusA family protein [Candidatus Falkowbacteria bacterium]MBT4433449.1 sulfurtransferase TusA family protein [Candidatus Falkowbacteria bacterium]
MNVNEKIDLTGIPCPHNFARALFRLETMDEGEILEIIIDDGRPIKKMPTRLTEEGYKIIKKEKKGENWILEIKK